MGYIEIMKMLKYITRDKNSNLKTDKLTVEHWDKIIDQFAFDAERVDYTSIMGVVGYAIMSPQGQKTNPKVIELVKRLMARKAKL